MKPSSRDEREISSSDDYFSTMENVAYRTLNRSLSNINAGSEGIYV